jgi:biotin synthase
MIFMAGASALMVGNYLTTLNQPAEQDLQMLKDLGLDPDWEAHEEMESGSCGEGGGCGCSAKLEPAEVSA